MSTQEPLLLGEDAGNRLQLVPTDSGFTVALINEGVQSMAFILTPGELLQVGLWATRNYLEASRVFKGEDKGPTIDLPAGI